MLYSVSDGRRVQHIVLFSADGPMSDPTKSSGTRIKLQRVKQTLLMGLLLGLLLGLPLGLLLGLMLKLLLGLIIPQRR